MGMVRIEKGKHLIHKDDAQEKLEIILQGRVNMIVGDEVIPLDTGTIIGIPVKNRDIAVIILLQKIRC